MSDVLHRHTQMLKCIPCTLLTLPCPWYAPKHKVLPGVLACGLLPVLVGQLRAAASAPLEQQLLVAGLGLLGTMARVDGGARARLAATRGLAGALAAALGGGGVAVKWPALQLLQVRAPWEGARRW